MMDNDVKKHALNILLLLSGLSKSSGCLALGSNLKCNGSE
jgi:hypothetical protein